MVGVGAGTVWMGRWVRVEIGGVGFVGDGGRAVLVVVVVVG